MTTRYESQLDLRYAWTQLLVMAGAAASGEHLRMWPHHVTSWYPLYQFCGATGMEYQLTTHTMLIQFNFYPENQTYAWVIIMIWIIMFDSF